MAETINIVYFPKLKFSSDPDFQPNITPKQMLQLGVFGGTYYREIYCPIHKKVFKNTHLEYSWMTDKLSERCTRSWQNYSIGMNYYKSICGTSFEYWHSKNWIRAEDPYGWYQWYCRYYQGRRSKDDRRQINRWRRQSSRWANVKKTNKMKQVLLHWGIFLGDCTDSCTHNNKYLCITNYTENV